MQLLAEGNSNKAIATRLDLSVKTVETHPASVMRKLRPLNSLAHKNGLPSAITSFSRKSDPDSNLPGGPPDLRAVRGGDVAPAVIGLQAMQQQQRRPAPADGEMASPSPPLRRDAPPASLRVMGLYFRCWARCLFISNMLTLSLPNTARTRPLFACTALRPQTGAFVRAPIPHPPHKRRWASHAHIRQGA